MRSLGEILLPTDFSPRSADVARYAAAVARHFKSKITLLHVLPPLDPAWAALGGGGATVEEVLAHQKKQLCNSLKLFLTEELRDLAVKRIVYEGDPAEVITAYCAAERVGLVMMPTRGWSAFRRFLLGSVTAKILHDVNCSVWTSAHVIDGHPTVSVIPKVIMCAIDLTPEGDLILQWAADLASELQARLIVAHAMPSLQYQPEAYFLEAHMRRSLIGDAHAKILRVLQGSRMPGAEVRVEGGRVSTVVRSLAEDSRADLLIIGRASNRGVRGRLRTHSYALIRESPCPVISI
jgi:nucleotide-binding universal stress UspA family protein